MPQVEFSLVGELRDGGRLVGMRMQIRACYDELTLLTLPKKPLPPLPPTFLLGTAMTFLVVDHLWCDVDDSLHVYS